MIRYAIAFLLMFIVLAAHGQPVPQASEPFPIPDQYELVNDFIGILPLTKRLEIREKLRVLERKNGTQVVLLFVPGTGPDGLEPYIDRVFRKWDIGNNGEGNGVLFLIDGNAGRSFIATGPGIAGALPDAKVRQIYAKVIEPLWQNDQFAQGIEAGVDAIIAAASKEETKATFYDYINGGKGLRTQQLAAAGLALLGVVYALVLIIKRRRARKSKKMDLP